jgi:hypothetical protein
MQKEIYAMEEIWDFISDTLVPGPVLIKLYLSVY